MSRTDNPDEAAPTSLVGGDGKTQPLLSSTQECTQYGSIESEGEGPPFKNSDPELGNTGHPRKHIGIWGILFVLLLGVFISQTDQSLVIATYGNISSEFNDLDSGNWLISAYILSQCVAQPLYGRLSDIYGRKICLQASYVFFGLGTAGCGLGRTMGQVIASRAIQGIGGAGMVSMVSIILTDLVPMHEVASYRSYVNVLSTAGRSCGGVLGGLLMQTLGWRWAFLVQLPPTILALFLVQWRLSLPSDAKTQKENYWSKLKRIDFMGAFLLCFSIFVACLILDLGGQKVRWDSPVIMSLAASGSMSVIMFVIWAKRAQEPIFPIKLMTRFDVVCNYLVAVVQMMIQIGLMVSVPLYFQSTAEATPAQAGAYLIPAFLGNTFGGLVAGYWIKSNGRYKIPTVLSPIFSIGCMLLCLFTWNGHTTVWQSLFIFPGGFATGMVFSSAFVGLTAELPEKDIAVASSGFYLCANIGAIAGTSAAGAVYQTTLRSGLQKLLQDTPHKRRLLSRLLENMNYLRELDDKTKSIVMPAYVDSFRQVTVMGLGLNAVSLILAVLSPGVRLKR
ncbi:putative major facilitator superfamily transporter [Acrodontium crateriforme]|uniref:Major facilitator superfamily transporter n=1 Tax=Acrodontium crateriforme TaxID=150365 RepID=A0AAQ3RD36_9PEZI|nr:putative major facilitator superfamily transporter [Acrodontium crateriforme]